MNSFKKHKMTRFLIVFTFTLLTTVGFAQEIKWMTLSQAVEAQKKNPKKIMMDVFTDWCGPCKMLDKNTFQNSDVVKYVNENFYAVKFDAENGETITFKGKEYKNPGFIPGKKGRKSVHQLTQAFGVSGYPTILFLDEKSDLIMPLVGYYNPQQIEIYLKLFGGNDYKNVETQEKWEAYQANFKPTFK